MTVCALSEGSDFADYLEFWDARISASYNLRAFQNGSEAVKLAGQRRRAIHTGMRFVGGWRFRRLLSVLGRPYIGLVQPEGVSKRFRGGETRRTAAKSYTYRYALRRWLAISPPIKRFGTPVFMSGNDSPHPTPSQCKVSGFRCFPAYHGLFSRAPLRWKYPRWNPCPRCGRRSGLW